MRKNHLSIFLLAICVLCIISVMMLPATAFAAKDRDLLRAVEKGDTAQVKSLLASGADPNARDSRKSDSTALILATLSGHTDMVRALLESGADVNAQERSGATALMFATSKGDADVVDILLSAGADPNAQNNIGWTALMIAANGGHTPIVRALLAANASVQTKNNNGETALMVVDRSKGGEIVQLLTQSVAQVAPRSSDRPLVISPGDGRGVQHAPSVAETTALSLENLGRYHALVIGNDRYEHLPPLKTAVRDATAVAQLLERDYNFNVKLLLNANRAQIIGNFDALIDTLNEQDNLLIYYAGHGHLEENIGRGYWLPIDAMQDTRISWLSNSDINDTLKVLRAKHVLIVSDSCYAAALTTRGIKAVALNAASDYGRFLDRMMRKRSRKLLTSGGNEPVQDSSSGGDHSVFAKAFLESLRDNNGILLGQDLFFQVKWQVVVNARQTPEYDTLRYVDDEGGDFLFVRKR